jgi:hypothetical protein
MVDDIKDAPQDKPSISATIGRTTSTQGNKLKDVNIFPALTDRRGIPPGNPNFDFLPSDL